MPFGSLVTNQTPLFVEHHIQSSWSTTIGQGGNWTVAVSSMTMPFNGDIMVDLWVQASYTAAILQLEVWPATPIGATNFWAGKVLEYDPSGGWLVCPMFGRWANIAQGTFFQLTIDVRVPVANGTATVQGQQGLMRAVAS